MMRRMLVFLFVLVLMRTGLSIEHQSVRLADSGGVAVISIDTTAIRTQTIFIDTTYFPSERGKSFDFYNYLLFKYGIGDYDTLMVDLLANDSAHIGVFLETSFDGDVWKKVFSDTTIRTRFTTDGDSVPRYKGFSTSVALDTLVTGTKMGSRFRAGLLIYISVDSAGIDTSAAYGVDDTVYTHKLELHGFDVE